MNEQIIELEAKLQDLYEGRKVVVPCDIDHAHNMLMVSCAYIRDDKRNVWNILKKDYGVEE
jgi:hypothetical protein